MGAPLQCVRLCIPLSLLLLLLPLMAPTAQALENKCSACVAIQHELMDILIQERPRSPLDLRNRLNSQGKREGKVIDYKDSELRIIQILEGLCEKLKKYSLINTGKDKKRIWMHGQKHATDRLRLIAEEQGKELKRFCDRVLEEFEDDMTEMIREEVKTVYKEVPILLCRNITANCKDEEAYLAETEKMAQHWPRDENATLPPGSPRINVETKDGAGLEEGTESTDTEQKSNEEAEGDLEGAKDEL